VNLLIEKTRRLAYGFRNFSNYRLRILARRRLTPLPTRPTTPKAEEPCWVTIRADQPDFTGYRLMAVGEGNGSRPCAAPNANDSRSTMGG
jgi:hypothetical protein